VTAALALEDNNGARTRDREFIAPVWIVPGQRSVSCAPNTGRTPAIVMA
jgi:hypothetical protein